MATKNDITGDLIVNKNNSEEYRIGLDRIFNQNNKATSEKTNSQVASKINNKNSIDSKTK